MEKRKLLENTGNLVEIPQKKTSISTGVIFLSNSQSNAGIATHFIN